MHETSFSKQKKYLVFFLFSSVRSGLKTAGADAAGADADFRLIFRMSIYRCVLQMGGSDQWGNMVNGVDLGRRVEKAELFALTAPLITTSEGKKMGKSASGAVWLNADKLPVYDYWQVRQI